MTYDTSGIPASHPGQIYTDFLASLALKRRTRIYFEIGVRYGDLMAQIACDTAIGVDPFFEINKNIANGKRRALIYQMTSDEFFRDRSAVESLGGAPDLSFLDGLHTFEFLLRDFYNTEMISDRDSIIAMHDCLPLSAEMAHRSESESIRIGQSGRYPNYWTGDVWKVIPILKKYRPDLRMTFVDCPPTGVVFVSALDNRSTVLRDRYFEIVDEFSGEPATEKRIEQLYATINVVQSSSVLNEWDYSLYL